MRAGKRQLMVEEAERFFVFCLTCVVCAPDTVGACMVTFFGFARRALWLPCIADSLLLSRTGIRVCFV